VCERNSCGIAQYGAVTLHATTYQQHAVMKRDPTRLQVGKPRVSKHHNLTRVRACLALQLTAIAATMCIYYANLHAHAGQAALSKN
jgi:hypothetical protein